MKLVAMRIISDFSTIISLVVYHISIFIHFRPSGRAIILAGFLVCRISREPWPKLHGPSIVETRCTSQREGIIFSSGGRRAFAHMESACRRTGEDKKGGSRTAHKGAARGSNAEPSLTFVVMWIKRARRHEAVRLVWSKNWKKHVIVSDFRANKSFHRFLDFVVWLNVLFVNDCSKLK